VSTVSPLDLSACFRYAREHWRPFAGPAAGSCFAYALIAAALCAVPCVGPAAALFLVPPLQAGVSVVALAHLKGIRWGFDDFFSGFEWGGATIGIAFCTLLFALLLVPLGVVALLLIDRFFGYHPKPAEAAILLAFAVLGATAFAGLYTRLLSFALPLALDRRYGGTEALAGSWAVTAGHFWKLLGLNLLLLLINLAGALCFLVGLLVTYPFTILVWSAAYLLLAGARPPVSRRDQEGGDDF
jgi:hypothetical protein